VGKKPFDLSVICNTSFDIHHMQDQLFEIESFDELENKFRNWATQKGFLR
jgi:phenylalanine-4-hydroxylase